MKYTLEDLKVGTKLRCTNDKSFSHWTTGKVYTVQYGTMNNYVEADDGTEMPVRGMLSRLNKEDKCSGEFEIIKEEKEMTKYAKITKYGGLFDTDKENGLEIGKEYPIVSFEDAYTNDCRIYLNEEHPHYFISETQYELVEKEETPTFKTTIDLKSVIQAKIDALTTEAERLFTKRDRLEEHAINLNAKARRLEEVLETIKEFE